MSLRIPSFFLVVTLKLPGTRFPVPIVLPLFVLDDLLESVDVVMGIMSRGVSAIEQENSVYNNQVQCIAGQICSRFGMRPGYQINA